MWHAPRSGLACVRPASTPPWPSTYGRSAAAHPLAPPRPRPRGCPQRRRRTTTSPHHPLALHDTKMISTPRTEMSTYHAFSSQHQRDLLRVTATSSLRNRLKQRTASDLCVVRTVFRAEVSPGTGGEGLDGDGDVGRHLRLGYHRLLLLLCSPRRKRETSTISNEQQHAQKITESFRASELQGRVMVGGLQNRGRGMETG